MWWTQSPGTRPTRNRPLTNVAAGTSVTDDQGGRLARGRSDLWVAGGLAPGAPRRHIPDRSQLSMRFRSASTQKSLPSLLSTTRATGRMRPVVKRTSRSVPSRAARSILAARSCMLVKYRYLREGAGEGQVSRPAVSTATQSSPGPGRAGPHGCMGLNGVSPENSYLPRAQNGILIGNGVFVGTIKNQGEAIWSTPRAPGSWKRDKEGSLQSRPRGHSPADT